MPRPALKLAALAALVALGACSATGPKPPAPDLADPYLWLEDVESPRALAWVKERNAEATARLEADPRFEPIRREVLQVLDSRERLPSVTRLGDGLANFWRDAAHPRGLWRRTTLASFRQPEPSWETLIDLDALAKVEGANWVWKGATCLAPDDRRCLVRLSRGGADAVVVREFDTVERRFVRGGFELPEAKTWLNWLDEDHLFVSTDMGPGTLTESGYARTVRLWKRGTPLAQSALAFEGDRTDVGVGVDVDREPGLTRILAVRSLDTQRREHLLRQPDGRWLKLPLPLKSRLTFWGQRALVDLREDWTDGRGKRHAAGSLLAADAAALPSDKAAFETVFVPDARRALQRFDMTREHLLLTIAEDVTHRVEAVAPPSQPGAPWSRRALALPGQGQVGVTALNQPLRRDDPLAEAFLLTYVDFLTPPTLMLGDAGRATTQALKAQPALFDASGMRVEQRFATSRDGTRIPYFILWPRGAAADGRNPTMLYGYGGFQVSQAPAYSAAVGRTWLARGGVRVVANLRGGGEYGPAWHQAATGPRKQASYDDFIAVAEDLIRRRVTSPKHLGIMGGSNGGLLTGAVMLQRPDLFGAVVSQVPLLDMRRYDKLLAGASWVGEYGDPDDPAAWAWISKYSPYQNVRREMKLPPLLLITSTRDDRVHPAHARKMAARMIEQGHDVTSYENVEGGHGRAADNGQLARMVALEQVFLWRHLAPAAGTR